jgi:transposase-like protein
MAVSFKGAHFPKDVILTCVRWYVAYPLVRRIGVMEKYS